MLPGPDSKHRPRSARTSGHLRLDTFLVALLFASIVGGLLTFVTSRCKRCITQQCIGSHALLDPSRDGASNAHRLAVIIPYRDRLQHLRTMLPITRECLRRSNADASIFIMEQAPGLHFNRGALLNAAALFLADSSYDCLVFHDVDTVCSSNDNVAYRCPKGVAPLHLTPPGLHPRDDFPEFLGGNIVFTQEQFRIVNGFQHAFWGWGKEDNNMVRRLQLHHMWPPERPAVHVREKDFYWVHLGHEREKAVKILVHAARNREALANLEPRVHDDNRSGLKETRFRVLSIEPFLNATRVLVQLGCDRKMTPWCDQS